MSKKASKSKAPAGPKVDPYLEGLFSKLIERLMSLEHKMDKLMAQSGKSSGGSAPQNHAPQPQQQHQPPRRERQMYEAICAECSKVCEVPFKPTEDRPVYCKECWARRKNSSSQPLGHGMPRLTPVALPKKEPAKIPAPYLETAAANGSSKKSKKGASAKKAKAKKK